MPAAAQIVRHPATKEDARPNDPKVPDSYVLSGQFDRILVLRAKNKTDLLTEMEKQVKAQNIKNAVILSGIGSVRGYRLPQCRGPRLSGARHVLSARPTRRPTSSP